MAEVVEREPFTLNLGITDTSVLGNMKAIDAFLSDEDVVEEIDESTTAPVKKPLPTKKPVAVKKPAVVEEEEEIEEESIDPKTKKKELPKKKSVEEVLFPEDEEESEDPSTPEEEEEEQVVDGKTKKPDAVPPGNDYEVLSKDLVKLGVFSQADENAPLPKTGEELLAKFQEEGRNIATRWLDDFLGRFGQDRQELFEAIYVDGVDPKEYLPIYNRVQSLKGIDLTEEKNQQKVFREFYRRQGVADEKIESRLQKSIDNGFLEEDSKDYLEQLVRQDEEAAENQRVERANRQQAEIDSDESYKQAVTKILQEKLKTKEFNGLPLNEDVARKAYDFLYTKKYKTADGQKFTEFDKFILETKKAENLERRVAIALLALNNFDFSKIQKRAVSKEAGALFESLTQRKTKSKTEKPSASSPAPWF